MNKLESAGFETAVLVLLTFSRGAESRRKILASLLSNPKNCNQLSMETGLDWWAVQRHLQRLLGEKLVKSLDFGRIKIYDITTKGEDALRLCLAK